MITNLGIYIGQNTFDADYINNYHNIAVDYGFHSYNIPPVYLDYIDTSDVQPNIFVNIDWFNNQYTTSCRKAILSTILADYPKHNIVGINFTPVLHRTADGPISIIERDFAEITEFCRVNNLLPRLFFDHRYHTNLSVINQLMQLGWQNGLKNFFIGTFKEKSFNINNVLLAKNELDNTGLEINVGIFGPITYSHIKEYEYFTKRTNLAITNTVEAQNIVANSV